MKRMILEIGLFILLAIALVLAFCGPILLAQWLSLRVGEWFAFVVPIAALAYVIYYLLWGKK